ncbi:MAG: non-ribosomal peptide synthetase, partial [Verrucomicrobiota bacterium]
MRASANSSPATIPGRFAEVVARHAGRIAISTPGAKWTYAELDQRSNTLAARILDRLGATSEPVALLMQHDALLMATILGMLKAGKIYLALDPGNPTERSASMLADSRARHLLTDKSNAVPANSLASGQLQVLEIADDFPVASTSTTLPKVSSEAGAWLMYTSGSTGAPKGVWQNHRGVVCRTDVYGELIELTADDRLSLLAPCSLATSATPLFGALLNGATLCPFNVRSQGVERLADWLRREHVSVYHSVPTVFRHLARVAGDKRSFESLRLIRLDGEPMLRGDVEIFRQDAPANCRLMHALSSTETGLISALMIDRQTVLPDRRVPVGQPVRGVEVSLLNGQGRPVKTGDEGQIAVRSAQLAQGYWLRPEATAEKFRADNRDPRIRIFVTADVGRFLPDGNLEHLGRADQLVKIRGQQVDLGEVEAALQAIKSAQEAVVVAHEDSSGERQLVAYVVPHPGADVPPQTYRRELREQLLPEHMIPNDFVTLARLPQMPGGKVDRLALPLPPRETKAATGRSQKPRDFIEGELARIWQSVLGISPIGRHDDFFNLGGTSIQSAQVLVRIEEAFGTSLPPSTLVEHETIEKLAALLANHAVIPSPSPLVPLRAADAGRPLFLIHSGQGDVTTYGLLVRRLPGRPI